MKTNEIHVQEQSAFQTLPSLCSCVCRSTQYSISNPGGAGRRQGQVGPRTQRPCSPALWCGIRQERRNERRGPWGSDSHIPPSSVYQGHTHPLLHLLPPASLFIKARPSQSAKAGTCETWLILPPGLLAEDLNRELRVWRLNGTVCKTHLNWRLFCNVLFFLGICKGVDRRVGR